MIELTMCVGMFLGTCGQINKREYETFEECYTASEQAMKTDKNNNIKWIICARKVKANET